jgi:transcriptional regulator with XRE-family HTH domain
MTYKKTDLPITDNAIMKQLGYRLAQLRLSKNLTQEHVATEAGLGLRTLQRLELGISATALSSFIRVCQVLGLADQLTTLIPEIPPSPIAQLKLLGKQRRRAASLSAREPDQPSKWQWGPE